MISIKSLSGVTIQIIYDAFANAFSDYVEPFNLSYEQLKYMIERRGFNLDLSFGAFNKDQLVGFTLNGIGDWNGKLTAYDTGTGIIKEFRKKGVATKLFNESLPVLRENNISQYLLEVIRTNTSAYELYKKAGFDVTREFDYYISTKDKISINKNKLNKDFSIKEIKTPNWELFITFWDFIPSWQNSIDSINRKLEYFIILEIFDKDSVVGYGIIEKETGDIPQMSINKKYRRNGLATTLFYHLIQYSEKDEIKIINIPNTFYPFKKFATSINLTAGLGQYEMLLKL